MIDESTCWYNPKCHEEMIRGANGELWPVLEKSSHWPALKELLEDIPVDKANIKFLLDLGCGAGSLGAAEIVKNNFYYIGVDLSDVIVNVARKVNPVQSYLHCNMLNSNLKFLPTFGDVVVMNAFIDVMPDPVNMLIDVLDNCTKYVIIHRQFVIDGPTNVKKTSSYGGFTYISHINRLEFDNAIRHFKIVKEIGTGLGKDNYSYLLERFKS